MKKINNEENNYVEKGRKSFKIVKTEVSKIYDDATSDKEFSKSFLIELLNKNEKLSYELANAIMLIQMDLEKTLTKNMDKIKKYRTLITVLGIISILSGIINGYIGLMLCISYAGIAYVTAKKRNELLTESENKIKDTEEAMLLINPLNNNIKNNRVLLTKKINHLDAKEEIQRKSEPSEVSKIELANNIIQGYFETGILPEFNEDIKQTIISILKSDLDSEENDIKKLLEEARKKVSFDVDKSTVLELFIKEGSKIENGKTSK